jgi:folate-binding protein YgfZ
MSKGSFMMLEQRGILSITGRDAGSFLQGYVTSDVDELTNTDWNAGAFCNLKGRMIANFRMLNHTGNLLISMNRSLVEPTHQFLKKYIVFSKAETSDVSNDYCVIGILGDGCAEAIKNIFGSVPEADTCYQLVDDHFILRIPGVNDRFEIWLKSESAETVAAALTSQLSLASEAEWSLSEVQSGWAWLSQKTTEQYLPQMLNLQAQEAISFSKGCYLGQEIVARMQYLGQLKRTMHRFSVDSASQPVAGDKIISPDGATVGEIVIAEASDAGFEVLAVIKTSDEDEALLLASGEALDALPLPYHCAAE